MDVRGPQRNGGIRRRTLCANGGPDSFVPMGSWNGNVIYQGIEPYPGNVFRIERNRDSPAQARYRAADAKVLQHIAFQQANHLVPAIFRHYKIWVLSDIIHQPLLMVSQLEKIVFLF